MFTKIPFKHMFLRYYEFIQILKQFKVGAVNGIYEVIFLHCSKEDCGNVNGRCRGY